MLLLMLLLLAVVVVMVQRSLPVNCCGHPSGASCHQHQHQQQQQQGHNPHQRATRTACLLAL
jgi:hypothetical protein